MAGKMELKKAAELLKQPGQKEKECIDWDTTGIEFFNGEDMTPYIEKCKEARKKKEATKKKTA